MKSSVRVLLEKVGMSIPAYQISAKDYAEKRYEVVENHFSEFWLNKRLYTVLYVKIDGRGGRTSFCKSYAMIVKLLLEEVTGLPVHCVPTEVGKPFRIIRLSYNIRKGNFRCRLPHMIRTEVEGAISEQNKSYL